MSRAKNATRIVAAIGLLVGFAFVAPPAIAAEEETDASEPDVTTAQAIPACASNPEVGAGPVTVGLDYYCERYAEVDTEVVHCSVYQDKDTDVDCQPTVLTAAAIPPCATTPEPSAGPATAGLDDFCNPWVEIETDAADCLAETDRPDANVECETGQPTTTAEAGPDVCIPFTHEGETGPVSYTFTGCDVEVSVQTDLDSSGDEDPTERCSIEETDGPVPVVVACQLSSSGQNCPHVYWKVDAVVVVWEQRSACDGEIYVKEKWKP